MALEGYWAVEPSAGAAGDEHWDGGAWVGRWHGPLLPEQLQPGDTYEVTPQPCPVCGTLGGYRADLATWEYEWATYAHTRRGATVTWVWGPCGCEFIPDPVLARLPWQR